MLKLALGAVLLGLVPLLANCTAERNIDFEKRYGPGSQEKAENCVGANCSSPIERLSFRPYPGSFFHPEFQVFSLDLSVVGTSFQTFALTISKDDHFVYFVDQRVGVVNCTKGEMQTTLTNCKELSISVELPIKLDKREIPTEVSIKYYPYQNWLGELHYNNQVTPLEGNVATTHITVRTMNYTQSMLALYLSDQPFQTCQTHYKTQSRSPISRTHWESVYLCLHGDHDVRYISDRKISRKKRDSLQKGRILLKMKGVSRSGREPASYKIRSWREQ